MDELESQVCLGQDVDWHVAFINWAGEIVAGPVGAENSNVPFGDVPHALWMQTGVLPVRGLEVSLTDGSASDLSELTEEVGRPVGGLDCVFEQKTTQAPAFATLFRFPP